MREARGPLRFCTRVAALGTAALILGSCTATEPAPKPSVSVAVALYQGNPADLPTVAVPRSEAILLAGGFEATCGLGAASGGVDIVGSELTVHLTFAPTKYSCPFAESQYRYDALIQNVPIGEYELRVLVKYAAADEFLVLTQPIKVQEAFGRLSR